MKTTNHRFLQQTIAAGFGAAAFFPVAARA
jgi:hypothetical protein